MLSIVPLSVSKSGTFAYCSSMQKTTGATPFTCSLMFGREVRLPIDLKFNTLPDHPPPSSTSEYAQTLWEHLQKAYHLVHEHTKAKQLRQKELCDWRIGGYPYMYLVNNHVWLQLYTLLLFQRVKHGSFIDHGKVPFEWWQFGVMLFTTYSVWAQGKGKWCIMTGWSHTMGSRWRRRERQLHLPRRVVAIRYMCTPQKNSARYQPWWIGTELKQEEAELEQNPPEPPLRCSERNRCPPQQYGFDEVYVWGHTLFFCYIYIYITV